MTNWKLQLKYGKIQSPYSHFTVLADGEVGELNPDFKCRKGKAWMGMKIWSSSSEQSVEMVESIGQDIGFNVTGKIMVYKTQPNQPPRENPYAYEITFTPYGE